MSPFLQILVGLCVCALFFWMITTSQNIPDGRIVSHDDLIDPNNSYQVGYLVGLTGGTIMDANVVRQALDRFEQIHGYKPTLRDAALVVGLMQSQ